ncbi:MAG: type II toxin-antitoxin system VapC family toxin [Pseudomonadota bacterium]
MKPLLIDTNIYSFAMRGDEDVVDVLRRAEHIGFSVISIGELLYGFKGGDGEARNRELLDSFLDGPRVHVYPVNEVTAQFYAEIIINLKKVGKPIPTNDIWIAAVAFQHGLTIYSKDRHFQFIPGLSSI